MSDFMDSYLDVEERESKKIQKGNLRRLLGQMFAQPGPLTVGMGMVCLSTAGVLLEPMLLGYAIDDAIVPRDWEKLKVLIALYVAATSARVIGAVGQGYFFEVLGQRVTQRLRLALFSHLQRQSLSVFDKNPAGRLLTRVTNDVASLNEMFSAGFVSMLSNVLMVVGIFAFMMMLDFKLGCIAAAVFPPLAYLSVRFSRMLRIAYRDARSRLSALNAFLAENMLGIKVLQLFNREKLHLSRFDRLNQWYMDAQVSSVRVFALFQPTITLASGIAMALVIYYGGLKAHESQIKLGVLVAFFSYVLSVFQPMREIADKWNVFLSGMASAERIFSILDWPAEVSEIETVRPLLVQGHIVFENVWFAYSGEHWVLKDFSFEFKPGQKVGIVGHTGAGKTTLISLLMRFYEPNRGRILLDGRDLRDIPKRTLRAAIGVIQQDVFLFSGSLKDNVSFWDSSPGDPGSYLKPEEGNKVLLERGANISMGQKQMLAFSRALAADPKIWILDEATANMDSTSEAELQEALESASGGRTTLLIAHRLATVRGADKIAVLHHGTLVEQGSHAELIEHNGLYARLYQYQAQVKEF